MEGQHMATIRTTQSGQARFQTYTVTTHHVEVALADLLSEFDVSDEVILLITTPSGRDQRVRVNRNLLVPSRDANQVVDL